jgi:hypothetical protein
VIRTHDSGVLDWPVVFPHSLALFTSSATANTNTTTMDTTDPANYVWGAADEYYGTILAGGLEPYFRLGTSWGQLRGGLPPSDVPYNRTALVDVLLHTVKHFVDGWGGGRNFTGPITPRYWEVWNEPDSQVESGGRFWQV